MSPGMYTVKRSQLLTKNLKKKKGGGGLKVISKIIPHLFYELASEFLNNHASDFRNFISQLTHIIATLGLITILKILFLTSQILFQPLNPSWFFTCRQVGLVSMVHVFDLIRNIKLNKNINKFSLEFIWYMSVSIIAANHYIRPEEEISLEATKVIDITWNNGTAVERSDPGAGLQDSLI